jgi:3-methyladenine DNA glycosylase Tag
LKMKVFRWLVFMKLNRFSSGIKRTRISLRKQRGYRRLFYDFEVLQYRGS